MRHTEQLFRPYWVSLAVHTGISTTRDRTSNPRMQKPKYIYIYTYIYCHPQTDCIVLSKLFSVARYVGRSKPGSKPIQIYVRLSLRPLGQQAYHVWLREFLRYLCSNSSSRLFTFLYPIGYQSAQFFRRALHYANGGRKFLHQSAQYIFASDLFFISSRSSLLNDCSNCYEKQDWNKIFNEIDIWISK